MKTGVRCQVSGVSKKRIRDFCSFALFLLFTFHFSLLTCEAKIYIDITSPAIKNFPSLFRNSAAQRGDR